MTDTQKKIFAFTNDLKANDKLLTMDEASIKQAVALRLLALLGWDIFNVEEVHPDFPSGATPVSYALCIDNGAKVFIEVRRDDGRMQDIHETLVACAARHAVELAVHTDGGRWWFYLPSAEGSLKQKQCLAFDVFESLPETMASNLMALLSRNEVVTGEYLQAARSAFQSQMLKMAADALPAAWNSLLAKPDHSLVELLSDATEEICGCKAELAAVEGFIRANLGSWLLSDEIPAGSIDGRKLIEQGSHDLPVDGAQSSNIKTKKPEFFADKSIISYTFQEKTFSVKSWGEMLTTLCNFLAAANPSNFEKVLWLDAKHVPGFSRYSDQFKIPKKIKKTNIYVETKLSPQEIVKTLGDLLTHFGYGHDELVITTR